jgi:hypothetical protein
MMPGTRFIDLPAEGRPVDLGGVAPSSGHPLICFQNIRILLSMHGTQGR